MYCLPNGKLETISVTEVVVGDIVLISSGNSIPADGYIIEGKLTVNEANINGETQDKEKIGVSMFIHQLFVMKVKPK